MNAYGDYVWSSNEPIATNPIQNQLMAAGVVGGVGIGSLAYLSTHGTAEYNGIDTIAYTASHLGDLTPFGAGNTFQVPEFLSPYTSPAYQGIAEDMTYEWSPGSLGDKSTQDYLRKAFGLSVDDLENAGITPGMHGGSSEGLYFRRTAESPTGRLFSKVGDQEVTLSNSVNLMKRARDSEDFLHDSSNTNRAARSVFQSLDMWSHEGFNQDKVLGGVDSPESKWMPVPSVTGKINSVGDLWRSTAQIRAIPAFELDRFNRLSSGLVHQIFGEGGVNAWRKVTGLGLETVPGPASTTFMRIGGRAAMAGAAIGAVAQGDWIRRNYGLPGQALASGSVSAGLAYSASKLGVNNKASLMIGLASFAGQQILPGFDKGIPQGIADTYAKSQEMKASAFNPVNHHRRTVEGYFPGASDWKIGIGLGITAALSTMVTVPGTGGTRLPAHIMNKYGSQALGIGNQNVHAPPSARDNFWSRVVKDNGLLGHTDLSDLGDASSFTSRLKINYRLGMSILNKETSVTDVMRRFSSLWDESISWHKTQADHNPVDAALLNRLDQINNTYSGNDFMSRMGKEIHGAYEQVKFSWFGATPAHKTTAEGIRNLGFGRVPLPEIDGIPLPKSLNISPTGKLGRLTSIGLAAFGAHGLITGGLFGSMETSEELHDMYSGKEMVKVRKSRWWEAGGTAFEGSSDHYYRPHAIALMRNRVREKGVWGANEDNISPIGKFFRKNFTYQLEEQNYHSRPYPITSAAFSDVPVIGGFLANTIGRFIKPAKLMHVNEWAQQNASGENEYASVYRGWRREPDYDSGSIKPGVPDTPYDLTQQLGQSYYQFNELSGLTGWVRSTVMGAMTGEDQIFTDNPVLANSGSMTSPIVRFWEANLGGLGFTNEALRRVLPKYRSEIDTQNPINNNMASWLPAKFHKGDAYRAVEWGEARMPGAGYAAMHPELQGVDPEAYPLIHRYAILADVGTFTKEFRNTRNLMYMRRQQGQTSAAENDYMDRIDKQVRTKFNRFEYEPVHENANQYIGSGITQALTAGAKSILRKTAAPVEYLVPMGFRPVQKLMGDDRDPIEQYEYDRMYGTPMAFWDKPWRDWLRPAMYSAANLAGFQGKPLWRKEADETNAYFDRLEFSKWMTLAQAAEANGDGRARNRYYDLAGSTTYGVNPQGNPLSIFWSLPEQDRKFFNAFSNAQGADRDRILEMVPQNQVHLYKAVWSRMDNGDDRDLFAGTSTAVDQHYLTSQFYALKDSNFEEPPADWIGWSEAVDMEDVKVKYIDELGKDLHDYGLWESSLRKVARQPHLENVTDYIHDANRGSVDSDLYQNANGFVTVHSNASMTPYAKVNYNDDRTSAVSSTLRTYLGSY